MKPRLSFLVIIVLLFGCKPEKVDLVSPPFAQLEEYGIFDFKVEGIPTENISILTGLSGAITGILIRLPPDYKGGNKIKVFFKNWEKLLSDSWHTEKGWENGSIIYEGNRISIAAGRYTVAFIDINLFVIPYASTEILSNGKPYLFTVSGSDTQMKILTRNWGTNWTPYDGDYRVHFIHNTSGKIVGTYTESSVPDKEDEPTPVMIKIPQGMEAGEYKVVIFSSGKEIVLPDELVLQYGKPEMESDSWPNYVTDTSRTLTFRGYNFVENHTYELVISNDFVKERKLMLTRNNARVLSVVLPDDVIDGNYMKEILMDGHPLPLDNVIKSDNIIIVQNDYKQTRLMSLTNYSQKYTTPYGLEVFKPLTKFKRGSELMAIMTTPDAVFWKDKKMYLKAIISGKEYILYNDYLSGFFPNDIFDHSYFLITMDVPVGQYEIRVSTMPDGVNTYYSERYHRIITID